MVQAMLLLCTAKRKICWFYIFHVSRIWDISMILLFLIDKLPHVPFHFPCYEDVRVYTQSRAKSSFTNWNNIYEITEHDNDFKSSSLLYYFSFFRRSLICHEELCFWSNSNMIKFLMILIFGGDILFFSLWNVIHLCFLSKEFKIWI